MEDMPGKGTTTDDVSALQERLESVERSAAAKEQQLERYAADLRETFKRERERRHELRRSYMATVRALCNAVEARDAYTGKHAERVAAYGMEIARVLDAPFADDPEVEFGFLLHDVGKVAVPDEILRKPGPLTAAELGEIRRHSRIGAELVARVEGLHAIVPWILHSHEHFDGSGYPDGLSGNGIPLASRILLVADAFDAMMSDRPYRDAVSREAALRELEEHAGGQFDPDCVELLLGHVRAGVAA